VKHSLQQMYWINSWKFSGPFCSFLEKGTSYIYLDSDAENDCQQPVSFIIQLLNSYWLKVE